MNDTMAAVQMYAPGDIRLEQVAKPRPGPGQVLMKVAACGVCGSDLARMYKKGPHKLPLITGHEFSAYVEELGPGVTGLQVGDLVTVPPMIPCFECDPCLQGQFSLCENYDYYGSRRHGAYAQYVAGPANLLVKVPGGLDARAAAMVDPSAIALHAIRRTKITVTSRVAVLGGGGPIGLFAIQWARILGAATVVAVDVSQEKAELARLAGADAAYTSFDDLESAMGSGFDVVVETTGVAAIADRAVGITARHGDVTLIGIPNAAVEISERNWARLMRLEIDIHGSWNSFGAPYPGPEWTATLEHLARGSLRWEFMITHEAGLERVDELIRAMYERTIHSCKVLFLPNGRDLPTN
ncbi:MAG: galactitol-1-phosphate 5-dehydrogenase [Actinomycetaceae bacterium]|nr:galactitol-1-phosphate 5-dehydrogenase [Actinomycetaceae bacterium]